MGRHTPRRTARGVGQQTQAALGFVGKGAELMARA